MNIIPADTAISVLIGFSSLLTLILGTLIIRGRMDKNTWKEIWSDVRDISLEAGYSVTGIILGLLALLSPLTWLWWAVAAIAVLHTVTLTSSKRTRETTNQQKRPS